jgi:hypothetical protein
VPIYYLPPGPHVGGRQPYDNKDLPPSVEAVRVDDPPFSRRPPAFHSSWWDVSTPLQLRQSTPGVFATATANDPPFARRLPAFHSAWWSTYYPPLPGKVPPSLLDVPVSNPPFSQRRTPPFHFAWWDVLTPPQARQPSPGVFQVDVPLFGRQQTSYSAWQPSYPLPQLPERLPPSLLDVPVNDPPFARRLPSHHSAWWDVYVPQSLREYSPGAFATAQVDNPPFGARQQPYAAWTTAYVAPQLPDRIAPSLLDVRVDAPPFGKRFQQFYSAHWDPPPAPVQRSDVDASAGIPGQSVDNPPAARSTSPPWSWWLVDPAPTQLRKLSPGVPGQSVDNPPGISVAVPQSPAPLPSLEPYFDVQRRYLVQPFAAQAADSAPFSIVWQTIIRSWQYDPGAPRLPKLLAPALTAVQEDSPVPSHQARTPGSQQIAAWFAGVQPYRPGFFGLQTAAPPGWSVDPPPQFRIFVAQPLPLTPPQLPPSKVVQSGAAPVADQFPTSSSQLSLRWWTPQALPPVQPRPLSPGVPGMSADPPPGLAPAQPAALHWEQRRLIVVSSQLSPGVPGQSVDLPPPLAARQQSWRDGLYPATQPRPGVPSSAAVDFPPASTPDAGWSVAHWFAPYVAPQRHRPLSSALLAVRVDSPPFDARRLGMLASVVDRAQIPAPDRVYLRYVVQQGPALTLGTIVCGSVIVLPMFAAELTTLPAQSASPTSGPALDGDPSLDECD